MPTLSDRLDRWLGRTELETRIETLEAERQELREKLDAESDRRTAAVREKQEAQERVNRLEDRIADLEGRLDAVDETPRAVEYRRIEELRGDRLREVLDRLQSYRGRAETVLTAAVEDDRPAAVGSAFGERAHLVDEAAPCVAVTDDANLVSVALATPCPPEPFIRWDARIAIKDEWFLPEAQGRYAFALVRSDVFALGEYDGDEQVSVTGFDTEIPSKHSKGGFSQSRFERRRNEAVAAHLDDCRDALDGRDAERLILVGDRRAIGDLDVDADRTATVDASGRPREALKRAYRDFWTTDLYAV